MKGLAKFESCYKPTKCANVTNADLTTSWDGLNNPHLMYVMMMARKLEKNYLKESIEDDTIGQLAQKSQRIRRGEGQL